MGQLWLLSCVTIVLACDDGPDPEAVDGPDPETVDETGQPTADRPRPTVNEPAGAAVEEPAGEVEAGRVRHGPGEGAGEVEAGRVRNGPGEGAADGDWAAALGDEIGVMDGPNAGLGLRGEGVSNDGPPPAGGTIGSLGTASNMGSYGSEGRRAPVAPHARVALGVPAVRGELNPELVRRAVRRRLPEVRACYDEALGRRPELAGEVTMRLAISPTGEVATARADRGSMPPSELGACLVRAARRWEFPRPETGVVRVVLPLTFSVAQPASP